MSSAIDHSAQPSAQAHNVAAEFPKALAALRRDYDLFWSEMQECFAQIIAIPVGTAFENPVLLSARDWHPTEGRVPWKQRWIDEPGYDANGFWMIEVARSGRYRIELRTHPREADRPMSVASACLTVGENCWTEDVAEGVSHVSFDVELHAGLTRLCATVSDANGGRERGAYYTYVTKL